MSDRKRYEIDTVHDTSLEPIKKSNVSPLLWARNTGRRCWLCGDLNTLDKGFVECHQIAREGQGFGIVFEHEHRNCLTLQFFSMFPQKTLQDSLSLSICKFPIDDELPHSIVCNCGNVEIL